MGDRSSIEWTEDLQARFWSYVRKAVGCWLWKGGRFTRGYGQFRVGARKVRAHRASYDLHYGVVPIGMMVCHHCDNPLCVRPDHLFLGTARDNAQDRDSKGRGHAQPPPGRPGASNPAAKIDRAAVATIRALRQNGMTIKGIADAEGISPSQVRNIIAGRCWK